MLWAAAIVLLVVVVPVVVVLLNGVLQAARSIVPSVDGIAAVAAGRLSGSGGAGGGSASVESPWSGKVASR